MFRTAQNLSFLETYLQCYTLYIGVGRPSPAYAMDAYCILHTIFSKNNY